MTTSIYSLLIASTLSVTGILGASANAALSAHSHTEASFVNGKSFNGRLITGARLPLEGKPMLKGEPTFKGSEHFIRSFPNAMVESYETKGDFTKVNFSWNGDNLEAFYDAKGNLIATSHFINPDNLPLSVKMETRKRYADYRLFQAVEFNHTENGLSYYVIVKKEDKAVILQISADGNLTVLKKLQN